MVQVVTYAEIDRIFFQKLTNAVVAAGKLPNFRSYATPALYKVAKDTLRTTLATTKDYLIEVFGVGAEDDRDDKSFCKIIIDRTEEERGEYGGFPAVYFHTEDTTPDAATTYTKNQYPDSSTDVYYQIRIVGKNSKYDKIMSAIVKNAIKGRRFHNTIGNDGTETENSVFIEYLGGAYLGNVDFMERVFKFCVKDVFLEDAVETQANVPALSTLNYFVYGEAVNEFLMSNQQGQYSSAHYDSAHYLTD